jgi:hypothetical protein
VSGLTDLDRGTVAKARDLAAANNEYEITQAVGPADDVSYSALIARAFGRSQFLLRELADLAERLGGDEGQAAGPDEGSRRLAEIRGVLARFDWEHDDRQLALEAIDRIADGGQP